MMKMLIASCIVLYISLLPAKADEFMSGVLIKQENGKMFACTRDMGNGFIGCWQMYAPIKVCVVEKEKLACDVKES